MMSEKQERRLIGLLLKLVARDNGEPVPSRSHEMFAVPELGSQEHVDARTLVYMGLIQSRRGFMSDVGHSWSAEGIYAFDITDDGRAALDEWDGEIDDEEDRQPSDNEWIMVIHGSSNGQVPQIVEDIRLWCHDRGLPAYKAADFPNAGRSVREKVGDVTDEADYYVVVLTADEELVTGEFRPRPNTMIEMGKVLDRDPGIVCILKDDSVEMPSDYTDIITEPLSNWRSVLQRELEEAELL